MVDAHSELMTQYPWGFGGTVPNASDNAPDTRRLRQAAALVFRDTGQLPGETAQPLLHGDRRLRPRPASAAGPGPATTARSARAAAAPPTRRRRRCRASATTARSAAARAAGCATTSGSRGAGSTTLWIAVAGSENSVARGAQRVRRADRRPGRPARREEARRAARSRAGRKLDLPGDRLLQDSIDWGKQNLADLTQVGERTSTSAGPTRARSGRPRARCRACAGSAPASPTTRGCSASTASTPPTRASRSGSSSRSRTTCGRCATISDILSDDSGVVVHEVVADGSVWYGKDSRRTNPDGTISYDFNTDEIVKFPGAVALIWRWTGDDGFRDDMLDFTWRNLEYVRTQLDEDGDGWPEGNGNVERPGMGEEKLDNTVYYIRGLYDFADMARSAGQATRADAAEARADALARRFEDAWWIEADQQYADSLRDPGNAKINQKHWIGVDPMEAELYRDGEFVPGLAAFANGSRALATRENNCYSGERPGNRGLFHTGCGGGPDGRGRVRASSRSTPASRPSARATTAASAPSSSAATRTPTPRRSSPSRRPASTPDEQPGAMPEIMPSGRRPTRRRRPGTPPNIDRCWTCRSMFMQAWGHYGTAWAVVHQQLGVRPAPRPRPARGRPAGAGRAAERQGRGHPPGRRLGRRARLPRGQPLHDDHRHERGAGHDVPDRPHAAARVDGGLGRARRHGGDRLRVAGDQPRPRGAGRRPIPASATRSSSPPRSRDARSRGRCGGPDAG